MSHTPRSRSFTPHSWLRPVTYGVRLHVPGTLQPVTEDDTASIWAGAMGEAIRHELGTRPQRWLARTMGIDPTTVSRFVLGKQLPTLDQLDAAATAMGISRRYLLVNAGYIDEECEINLATLSADERVVILGAYNGVLSARRGDA